MIMVTLCMLKIGWEYIVHNTKKNNRKVIYQQNMKYDVDTVDTKLSVRMCMCNTNKPTLN